MESEKVKEIKKALECCSNWNGQSSCKDCPIGVEKCFEDENLMPRLALTLINELEIENERLVESCKNCHYIKDLEVANGHAKELKDRIAELEKENAKYNQKLTTNQWVQEICKEALKQFAERLKDKVVNTPHILGGERTIIDETLKEFL